jgi:hypothetical protein
MMSLSAPDRTRLWAALHESQEASVCRCRIVEQVEERTLDVIEQGDPERIIEWAVAMRRALYHTGFLSSDQGARHTLRLQQRTAASAAATTTPARDTGALREINCLTCLTTLATEPVLRRMLEHERQLRLSPETQREFGRREAEAERGGSDWIEYARELQRRVVLHELRQHHHIPDPPETLIQHALHLLRTATYVFPQLHDIPIQRRYNRAGPCRVRPGDDCGGDLRLYRLHAPHEPLLLTDALNVGVNQLTLVMSASLT